MNMKVAVVVGIVMGLLLASQVEASWFSDQIVKVRKYVTIGTSTKDGRLTVKGDGSADIANFQNSSGTEVGVFDADGDFTAKTVTSSAGLAGATVTSTGALSATTGEFTAVTLTSSLKPAGVTTDPCTASPYVPGSVFFNATSKYMCFCDGSSADLKMNDNSTACF